MMCRGQNLSARLNREKGGVDSPLPDYLIVTDTAFDGALLIPVVSTAVNEKL